MKIGMVLDQHFPPDIRVRKEAMTLANSGFDINLLSIGRGKEPQFEDMRFIKIHRFLNFPMGKFLSDLQITLNPITRFRMPIWEHRIRKFALSNSINVLHVHDLPLFKSAYLIAQQLGIKVVLDLHENYPYAIREWKRIGRFSSLKLKFIYDLKRWLEYERWAVSRADRVIVVVEEMKERLAKIHGISPKKIIVVPNTESLEFVNLPINQEIVKNYQNYFVISYIGGLAPHRGLDILIRAIPIVRRHVPNVKLLIIGGGNFRKRLELLVKKLSVESIVEFTGKRPISDIPTYIKISDIGVIPHYKNPHTDNTIPHKLFQYMIMGKPVIVSNCAPMERIVKETNSGLVFKSGDSVSLAEAILKLYKDKELRKLLSENARNSTLQGKWNWETTSKVLVELYRGMSE